LAAAAQKPGNGPASSGQKPDGAQAGGAAAAANTGATANPETPLSATSASDGAPVTGITAGTATAAATAAGNAAGSGVHPDADAPAPTHGGNSRATTADLKADTAGPGSPLQTPLSAPAPSVDPTQSAALQAAGTSGSGAAPASGANPAAQGLPAAPTAPVAGLVPMAGLAIELAARAQPGSNRFEIRLDPPDLGRIDVRLNVDKQGNVTSHLVVERSQTLAMLRNDAPQLERALQDAGLKTGTDGLQFSLSDQGAGAQNQSFQNGPAPNARVVVPIDDISIPVETARSYGRLVGASGGLDIRV
ncbi:MAG TPA: flagellar hook-length control protein FliK, partial [Xanthobacteraceae bacterium]|nr:flagellar hook-length control protein FliK [Xanthobacteraceae bacterium]